MRLILVDNLDERRHKFLPLALNRPLWELRCGITSLREKLTAKLGADGMAYFVPEYMAETYRTRVKEPVNDASVLTGDDVIVVDPLVRAEQFDIAVKGKSEVGTDETGRILYARVNAADLERFAGDDIGGLMARAKAGLPSVTCRLDTWEHIWDLVLANPEQITADFAAAGRRGLKGKVEQPCAILGSKQDLYIGPKARVHPMVVIDAENGPVYIDEGAEIQPFSRIEGPCYIGRQSVLLGAKCRDGNTIGPFCRIGGEVEASIIHGYTNKYHDGFIGHSYVGEWVNLGALTTNSDLKNDYSNVSVTLDGKRPVSTGSSKVGSFIGDHTKTSIGTLLNTGSYVGAMAVIMATGKPLPKYIPSFSWFVEGAVTKGFGRGRLYETAQAVMARRDRTWTEAERAMWDEVFQMTAPARDKAIKRGRKAMARRGRD